MAGNALLTIEQMYKADALAEQGGVPSLTLMEAAGEAIAEEIPNRWAKRQVVVLAGPGNNGGDGFVVARLLDEADWPVRVAVLGDVDTLTGDAAVNAERWQGETEVLSPDLLPDLLADNPLIVDALFGAGLSRPLAGTALAFVQAVNDRNLDCIAVDIPSGVIGDSGEMPGGKGFSFRGVIPSVYRRAIRCCTSCNGFATRRIGSPSVSIDKKGPRLLQNPVWTEFRVSDPAGRRLCFIILVLRLPLKGPD